MGVDGGSTDDTVSVVAPGGGILPGAGGGAFGIGRGVRRGQHPAAPGAALAAKEQPASTDSGLAVGSNREIVSRGLAFVQSAQAFDAQIHALGLTLHRDCHPLDVGLPLPFGALLRFGDVVPKLWQLTAEITFGHRSPHWQNMRLGLKSFEPAERSHTDILMIPQKAGGRNWARGW